METNERRNDDPKAMKTWPNMSCCGIDIDPRKMPDCCNSGPGTYDCHSMMSKCAKACRWVPLVPLTLGIVLLLLGYYLDAAMTRMLWMSVAGFVVLLGIFGLILQGRMKKMCIGTAGKNQMPSAGKSL